MAEEKKYFWLRLKRDFFKRHDIQIIEGLPNGKDYILFYLKLLCESVDHEGNLRFSDEIPYNEQMLSTITNTNIDIVRTAIKAFTELGMMDILDDGTLYMNGVEKLIGSETYWAERKREERRKKKLLLDNVQSVQPMSNQCQGKSKSKSKSNNNIYIVEQEDEKDSFSESCDEIIAYLNEKTGRSFKSKSDKTKKCIHARMSEGFTIDDFKAVIDIKTKQWLKDEKMNEYLRPETLFGTKFEGYLNQVPKREQPKAEKPLSELTESEWKELYNEGKVTMEDYYRYHE